MLVLVVDTNLFHEFLPIEQIPWAELGETEEVLLIVSDPVQTELDDHKKSSNARLRKRAIALTKRFRELILSNQMDELIHKESPKVVLRLDGTSPSVDSGATLDLSIPDDQLVAIAKSISESNPGHRTCVFSDDLRPLRKAKQVGLDAMAIPESWRRLPEKTDDERARDQLNSEIARLRKQEPALKLTANVDKIIDFILPIYDPLSQEEMEKALDILQAQHPKETRFDRSKDSAFTEAALGLRGISQREFRPISQDKIDQYTESDYPNWLEHCKEILSSAHNGLNYLHQQFPLEIELCNTGTRPAQDVLIKFSTNGPLRVMPDENEEDVEGRSAIHLPDPPTAPQGEWRTVDLVRDIVGGYHGPFGNHALHSSLLTSHLPDLSPARPRDPNGFYYQDRPSIPVDGYGLTCVQFRHGSQSELFAIRLYPEQDDLNPSHNRALLKVTCEASNLTDPEELSISIKFKHERRSTFDVVRDILSSAPFRLGR